MYLSGETQLDVQQKLVIPAGFRIMLACQFVLNKAQRKRNGIGCFREKAQKRGKNGSLRKSGL